jgi:hypothetical protein
MAHPRLDALTREDLFKAAGDTVPKGIRRWSVWIDEKRFPVKQIVREAANQLPGSDPRVTPADLTAHDAVRYLKRLGFGDQLRYEE